MEPDRYEYETPSIEAFPAPADEPPGGPEASPPDTRALAGVGPALRELLETILLTLVIFFMIRFAVENFRIEGYSMEPNFHDGQFLLVNKIAYKIGHPERNDVIIFHFPLNEQKNYIKRVIGLPGEQVQVIDGRIYVNGGLIPEPYPFEHADYNWGPATVSAGEYFVLGDNRPESSDSHFWGFVPARDVVGKAWVSYWPPQLWGLVPDYSSARASP
ncbi:MAG: signal peptidase I [Rudaea sp.]